VKTAFVSDTVNTLPESYRLPDGYTIRPGKMDDYKIAFDLFNLSALQLTGALDLTDPELIRNDWADPRFDMEKSTRMVFTPDGTLVGYVEVWDVSNPPVHPWIWGCVHPGYYGKGIGSAIFGWAEERTAQAIERVPADLRFAPRTGIVAQNKAARAMFGAHGWNYIRSYYRMETTFSGPPEVPPMPDGIVIRPYDPETEFEAVVKAFIDSFRDHFGFVERPLEEELTTFRHHFLGDPLYDPSLWFVAMDGSEIAGICLCRPEDYENPENGFVNELGVRREWRKRGLGTVLLKTSFAAFYQRGKKGAALGVDADSLTGALKIYERAGMRAARQFDNFEKELRPGREISTQSL
jgi:GNAT superfamily N-acetyltransferase